MLQIKELHVAAEDKQVLNGLNLELPKGEIHVIMGPNGSGKSTLANTIMGHPKYSITDGDICVDNDSVRELPPDKRAQKGLFLSMQYPPAVDGVTVSTFLRNVTETLTGEKQHPIKFYKSLVAKMQELGIDESFAKRGLNVGFSGGEKKRLEILQLLMIHPVYAILDETDSGLDVDALRAVAEGINTFHSEDNAVLLITHYTRILEYIEPDAVHIMMDGKIVKSGDKALAHNIEEQGYDAVCQ